MKALIILFHMSFIAFGIACGRYNLTSTWRSYSISRHDCDLTSSKHRIHVNANDNRRLVGSRRVVRG
ncbi:MAG: hypothetical protein MI923_09435 [Phycisphaerales bacterium]|nr:hypothetical protein [Phycisphaerales bacterium]